MITITEIELYRKSDGTDRNKTFEINSLFT